MTSSFASEAPFAPFACADGLVATAGIAALDPATMRPVIEDFAGQARWALERLDQVLAEAGAESLLRVECFLADREWYSAWDACYLNHFRHLRPPRTTLICGLPVEGLLIEIQALARTSTGPEPSTRRASIAVSDGADSVAATRENWTSR